MEPVERAPPERKAAAEKKAVAPVAPTVRRKGALAKPAAEPQPVPEASLAEPLDVVQARIRRNMTRT